MPKAMQDLYVYKRLNSLQDKQVLRLTWIGWGEPDNLVQCMRIFPSELVWIWSQNRHSAILHLMSASSFGTFALT